VEAGFEKERQAASAEAQVSPAETAASVDDDIVPLPEISGEGQPSTATAYANVTLRGQTDANFSSSFRTSGVRTTRATDCAGCDGADCVRMRGTLVSTFRVTTTVTLPSADNFPDLTPCQRQRVRQAITNQLAPHEQQHVSAFRQYNGTTRTPFDLTLCRTEANAAIQALHDAADMARQDAARTASAALDPFFVDVDLNCE
jgi:hypothetical protein